MIMRKIEKQMIEAISSSKNWKSGNTEVIHTIGAGGIAYADIYLHGNHIAVTSPNVATVNPNKETFRNWPTPTTRSRLNALGVNASIKNFRPHIDGMAL
tara:strand:+ start:365 stop:661 length:297 start_codon:yes stop_codon:yes gene_type:complete